MVKQDLALLQVELVATRQHEKDYVTNATSEC